MSPTVGAVLGVFRVRYPDERGSRSFAIVAAPETSRSASSLLSNRSTLNIQVTILDLGLAGMMTDHTSDGYLEVISLIERLHRQVLELIKLELDRLGMHDINNVQALMLFNIGEAEISVGELISRGYYLGSNVSYNVKKMIENGYLAHERSLHDRRSIRVRLTQNGRILRDGWTRCIGVTFKWLARPGSQTRTYNSSRPFYAKL